MLRLRGCIGNNIICYSRLHGYAKLSLKPVVSVSLRNASSLASSSPSLASSNSSALASSGDLFYIPRGVIVYPLSSGVSLTVEIGRQQSKQVGDLSNANFSRAIDERPSQYHHISFSAISFRVLGFGVVFFGLAYVFPYDYMRGLYSSSLVSMGEKPLAVGGSTKNEAGK